MKVQDNPSLYSNHVPRSWKQYFIEGFMIFIAVTLGFFADNLREYFSDKQKEKEYVRSFIEDLKADTATLNLSIQYNQQIATWDSIFSHLLYDNRSDSASLVKERELYQTSTSFYTQISDPRTYEQLKANGDLKLIRNDKFLDSLSDYYRVIEREKIYSEEIQSNLQSNYIFGTKIIDINLFSTSVDKSVDGRFNNPENRFEYVNRITQLHWAMKEYIRHMKELKEQAVKLLVLTRKEYRMKE